MGRRWDAIDAFMAHWPDTTKTRKKRLMILGRWTHHNTLQLHLRSKLSIPTHSIYVDNVDSDLLAIRMEVPVFVSKTLDYTNAPTK